MSAARAAVLGFTALGLAALASRGAALAQPAAEPKTLKERLSDKASDSQRVDNCHVPPSRQGPVVRPGCDRRPAAEAAASAAVR